MQVVFFMKTCALATDGHQFMLDFLKQFDQEWSNHSVNQELLFPFLKKITCIPLTTFH
jgi:hypothetical protein